MPQFTPSLIIFIILGGLALLSALGMLLSRNTVYSALLLVFNFTTVAFIYFMLGAPFIGLAQITVYAGAIMVLFLFVIMLLGTEQLGSNEPLNLSTILTVLVGLAVIAEAVYMFLVKNPTSLNVNVNNAAVDVTEIGTLLYGQYLLPFEITSFILLVAVVGAIILTKQDNPRQYLQQGKEKQ